MEADMLAWMLPPQFVVDLVDADGGTLQYAFGYPGVENPDANLDDTQRIQMDVWRAEYVKRVQEYTITRAVLNTVQTSGGLPAAVPAGAIYEEAYESASGEEEEEASVLESEEEAEEEEAEEEAAEKEAERVAEAEELAPPGTVKRAKKAFLEAAKKRELIRTPSRSFPSVKRWMLEDRSVSAAAGAAFARVDCDEGCECEPCEGCGACTEEAECGACAEPAKSTGAGLDKTLEKYAYATGD